MLRRIARSLHSFDIPGIHSISLRSKVDSMSNQFRQLDIQSKLGFLEIVCQNSEFEQVT